MQKGKRLRAQGQRDSQGRAKTKGEAAAQLGFGFEEKLGKN